MAPAPNNAQRIKLANVAEREIMRFKGNNALWLKHILDIVPDEIQDGKMALMDEHLNTVDYSARRTRKTSAKELHNLIRTATESGHALNIIAPKHDQAKNSFGYIEEAVRRSPILNAFIRWKDGKKQLSTTGLEFVNGSKIHTYGITSNLDGIDSTIADVEEVDDLDEDRLRDRFLLTRLGTETLFNQGDKREKSVRITGVFKGAGLIDKFIDDKSYYTLPAIDVWTGVAMGIINQEAVETDMDGMNDDQISRSLLCIRTSNKNFFHEKYVHRMMVRGNMKNLKIVEPVPGEIYEPRSPDSAIGIGYDAGGHGESDHPSRHACTVHEYHQGVSHYLYGREWDATADKSQVIADMVDIWAYFRPNEKLAYGDAYGVATISDICDALWDLRLVKINRRDFPGSSASTWEKWPFKPVRMEGFLKHAAFTYAQQEIHGGRVFAPLVDEDNRKDPEYATLERYTEQLKNIKSVTVKKIYNSYQMIKKAIGDDFVDASVLYFYGIGTQGMINIPTIIQSSTISRDKILNPGDRLAKGRAA